MSRRILLCDDEVHVIRAAEFKLSRAGYAVECAFDGEAAWEAIKRARPDLIVTDCQMPRLSGIGLVERIRANESTRDIPVFMLTGKGIELQQQNVAEHLGLLGIISKPFSPRELLVRVNEVLQVASSGVEA